MQNGLFLTRIIANKTVFTVWPPGKALFTANLRLHSLPNGVEFRGRIVHAQEPIALWVTLQIFAAVAFTIAALWRPVSPWLAAIQSVGSFLILALLTLPIVMTFAYGKLRRAASWLNVFLPGTVSRSLEKRPETGNGA